MSLVEYDLMGNKIDKVALAIQRLRAFEPPEGYYLAFSGGKDSTCIKALADMAGVKYDAHYSATTVDPPELVRFIRGYHPDVEIVKPEISMRKLIIKKHIPPTRLARYCCAYFKESHGKGRVTVTGTRWAESKNRRDNQGLVTVFSRNVKKNAEANGATYQEAVKSGLILNFDDGPTRRTVEQCYRTSTILVNPIIDWLDEDVWEFIKTQRLPYCCLYDEGWKRLGCVGCPMGGYAAMKAELTRWPVIRAVYMSAFAQMIVERKAHGLPCVWETAQDVMDWWLGDSKAKIIPGQMDMFGGVVE